MSRNFSVVPEVIGLDHATIPELDLELGSAKSFEDLMDRRFGNPKAVTVYSDQFIRTSHFLGPKLAVEAKLVDPEKFVSSLVPLELDFTLTFFALESHLP
jgi:hypothetical protein